PLSLLTLRPFPTRRSSDLQWTGQWPQTEDSVLEWSGSDLVPANRTFFFTDGYSGQRETTLKFRKPFVDPFQTVTQSKANVVEIRDRKSTRLHSSHVSISYA